MLVGKVSNYLRGKNAKHRWAYLGLRCLLDIFPSLLVFIGVGAFVGSSEESGSQGDAVLVLESLLFLLLLRLEISYELPFLGNQYGLRDGKIKNSFLGMSLEYLTEWRNGYILFCFVYKVCFVARLLNGNGENDEMIIVSVDFDYILQYILILVWWVANGAFERYKNI